MAAACLPRRVLGEAGSWGGLVLGLDGHRVGCVGAGAADEVTLLRHLSTMGARPVAPVQVGSHQATEALVASMKIPGVGSCRPL